jgi:hypothetical protein
MKFSLNIEYSEKEYLAATKTTGSMLGQLLGLLGSVRERGVSEHAAGGSFAPFSEEVPESGTVLPFPVEVPRTVKLPEKPAAPSQEEVEKQQKLLKKGEKAFCEFLHEWLKGIDMDTLLPREGAEQPDRDALLRSIASGQYTWSILAYVKECGGLQRAIAKVTSSERLGVELARFIVPPASISFYDLADLYEHHNPFNKDDEE